MNKECAFCNPEASAFAHFEKYGKERIDLVHLYETDRLIVKPDVLPAGAFHALVVPKVHEYSFARNHGLGEEYGRLLYQIEQDVGDVAVFEHGGVNDKKNSHLSVNHAHQHLISTNGLNVLDYMEGFMREEGIPIERREGLDPSPSVNVRGWQLSDTGYFYIQQGARGILAVNKDDDFPSQIAQRGMSRLLSGRELNWKLCGQDEELARESVYRISQIIEMCKG